LLQRSFDEGSEKNEDLVFQSDGRFLKKDIKVSRYVYGSDAGVAGVAGAAADDDECLMLCKFGGNPMATEGSPTSTTSSSLIFTTNCLFIPVL